MKNRIVSVGGGSKEQIFWSENKNRLFDLLKVLEPKSVQHIDEIFGEMCDNRLVMNRPAGDDEEGEHVRTFAAADFIFYGHDLEGDGKTNMYIARGEYNPFLQEINRAKGLPAWAPSRDWSQRGMCWEYALNENAVRNALKSPETVRIDLRNVASEASDNGLGELAWNMGLPVSFDWEKLRLNFNRFGMRKNEEKIKELIRFCGPEEELEGHITEFMLRRIAPDIYITHLSREYVIRHAKERAIVRIPTITLFYEAEVKIDLTGYSAPELSMRGRLHDK